MTSRTKISLLALSGIASVAGVLWMRSLASWRPAKVGQINAQYNVDFLSADGKVALLGASYDKCQIVDLGDGGGIKWSGSLNDTRVFSSNPPEYVAVINSQRKTSELEVRDLSSGQVMPSCSFPAGTPLFNSQILPLSDGKTVGVVQVPTPGKLGWFQWNIEDGKLVRHVVFNPSFAVPDDANAMFAVSSDGQRLIGCVQGKGVVWDIGSGKVVKQWTTSPNNFPISLSPNARVAVYTSQLTTVTMPTYYVVDASNGKTLWQTKDELFVIEGDEMFFPRKDGCDVIDVFTGQKKRRLPGPRDGDGNVLRITTEYIYTQSGKGEVFRWRAR